ncbi:RUN and FYVE domain-containing protein 1 [Fasciola hepatica]|uniref:RUN and FYVE domain-containing protein 1 n=1 Tax=Fasciola hepatica TaxID=6192 RepID=A0A4E0RGC3_FASHE|nr:RUN and FYVE domain-containing protein 1 [Fasciola hepatica]
MKRMTPGKKSISSLPPEESELHGFVCPECMKSFQSSTQLISHFDCHQVPNTAEETTAKDAHNTGTSALPYPQLLEEMSQHNNLLLEQLSGNTRRICELETALEMLINTSPVPPDFAFSDKELEHRIDMFLNNQTKFATMESELETTQAELKRKKIELNQLRDRLDQIDREPETPVATAAACTGPNGDEVTNLQAQLQASKLDDHAANVSALEIRLQTVCEELQLTQSALTTSEARCNELKEQLNNMRPNISSITVACQTDDLVPEELKEETESSELISARNQIIQLIAERNRLSNGVKNLHEQIVNCRTEQLSADYRAQNHARELTDSLQTIQTELDQVRSAHGARINELTLEHARLQATYDRLVTSSNQIRAERDVLHEQLDKLKEQLENAKIHNEELLRQQSDDHNQWSAERSNLNSQVSELKETVNDLENKTKNLENRCAELNRQLVNQQSLVSDAETKLAGQIEDSNQRVNEAQTQLQQSKKEVESLLERLIAAEDKYVSRQDQIQSQTQEIDCLKKAIFELGRENQSLQMLCERVTNRHWTKDDDVMHCSNCQSEFSLINRKHHCRQCGGIFCHNCSSYRASLAASKDPVRVCTSCYTELIGRGSY